ncbi:glycine--tRNA ligase subunit beta [Pseudomonadota bacterium]
MTETTHDRDTTADLLIELGCEELPPKALDKIRVAFFNAVQEGLEKNNILFDSQNSLSFSTPRRLALILANVASSQPDLDQERRGPALQAAFDSDGKPTGAAIGFARSVGKDVTELETVENEKGQWLFARIQQPGKSLSELIYPILEQAIKQLPVPRPMRWADHDFSFVRPVHWLIVLHGDQRLEGRLLGQDAGRLTWGHRVHAPGPHTVPDSGSYRQVLQDAFVIADPEQRKSRIRDNLLAADACVHIDANLLNEVNNLVEWPVVVSCSFEEEFLEVPHEALIASMQDHQKFFPVMDREKPGQVTNRFIAISNIESIRTESVRAGYERVIRPRLADARFFLEQDKKQPLESLIPLLDRVVFQKEIGSVGDKSKRMANISKNIADFIEMEAGPASRAALLAKCDLMTLMVGEFPELQGTMGRYYASISGETDDVAHAIGEHYSPRFAGDGIPASLTGKVVSLADRIDTLVGIFGAGLRPSGNKDPFALRRSALGLVRILIEAGFEIPLDRLLALAAIEMSAQLEIKPDLLLDVRGFIVDRSRAYYRDLGHGAELISAALASGWDTLPDLDRRLNALSEFMGQEEAASLAAANKRIGNILRKTDDVVSGTIDSNLFTFDEERYLFEEINRLDEIVLPLLEKGEYATSLKQLASLKQPVDAFFDSVMVMDKNDALRLNRLSLLSHLKALFDRIADLSVLA